MKMVAKSKSKVITTISIYIDKQNNKLINHSLN